MKSFLRFSVVFFLIVPFFSKCQTPQTPLSYEEKKINNSGLEGSLKLEKIEWEINVNDTPVFRHFAVKNIGDETIFVYFNNATKKLNLTSVLQHKLIKEIDVNSIITKDNNLESVYFHNFDSIFLQQMYNINLIDTCPTQAFKVPINQSKNPKMMLNNLGYGLPMIYDSLANQLLLGQYSLRYAFYDKKYFRQNIEATFNLSTQQFDETPFPYSKKYLEAYYGFAISAHRLVKDNYSIFTFQADPNIYVVNRCTGEVSVKAGKSAFHTAIQEMSLKYKNDSNKKMAHLTLSPLYLELFWDKYRKLYYRFFLKEQPDCNPDGTYNAWRNKKKILMVFNEDFTLLKEIELEDYLSHHYAFVAPQGFFIKADNSKQTNQNLKSILFEVLKFEK